MELKDTTQTKPKQIGTPHDDKIIQILCDTTESEWEDLKIIKTISHTTTTNFQLNDGSG